MSMVEIMIVSVIFVSALALTMEALTASKRYQTMAKTQDDLTTYEIDTLQRRLASDFALSGWYFYASEDIDGNGTLEPDEDLNGDSVLSANDFTDQALDPRLRYYPYLRGRLSAARGLAFLPRQEASGGELSSTADWRSSATTADMLVANARQIGLIFDPALAVEMLQPSNEPIFLRVSTGPWTDDPGEADRLQPSDMIFFPTYGRQASGGLVVPKGARAYDWRQVDNYADLPKSTDGQELVLRLSAWDDAAGTGTWRHRNSLLATDNPNYMRPYGVQAWGAALNDGASGARLRIQFETTAANLMYLDPTPGTDYQQPPSELREYTYALIPSPRGFGRLVRAHTAAQPTGGANLGVEVGDWITDPSRSTGYQIDLVLSDDVVRTVWMTRRHDRDLDANRVTLRVVVARVGADAVTEDGLRQVLWRAIDLSLCMRAMNESADQIAAEALVDVPALADNIPFVY
jgi:type II secretory pathway pseudopilin PulG